MQDRNGQIHEHMRERFYNVADGNSKKTVVTVLLIAMVSFGWGVSFLSLAVLLRRMAPMQMLATRWGLTAIVFLGLIAAGRIRIRLRGRHVFSLFLAGLAEPCAYSILEAYGIKLTSASTSAIFVATIPTMTLLLGTFFLRQRATLKLVISIAVTFLGVAVATFFSPAFSMGGTRTGMLCMILAILSAAVYSHASRIASAEFDAKAVTCVMAIEGAVLFNILAFLQGHGPETYLLPFSDAVTLGHFLFLALFCAFASYIGYNHLLSYIDPAIASNITGSLTTVIGVVAGILFSGDIWGWYTVVGMCITLVGVWLSSRCMTVSAPTPEDRSSSRPSHTGS